MELKASLKFSKRLSKQSFRRAAPWIAIKTKTGRSHVPPPMESRGAGQTFNKPCSQVENREPNVSLLDTHVNRNSGKSLFFGSLFVKV